MSEELRGSLRTTLRRSRKAMPSVRFSSEENRSDEFRGVGTDLKISQPVTPPVKKHSFFGAFFAHRNHDYRSDAPAADVVSPFVVNQPPRAVQNLGTSLTNNQASSNSAITDDDVVAFKPWQRCWQVMRTKCKPTKKMLDYMSRLINSRWWHFGTIFFTVVLLFGAEIQQLWIPKKGDIAFDILFTIAFVFFTIDIISRCYVEHLYFGFNVQGGTEEGPSAWGACKLCSFMFWCDLFSTLTLLFDISFIFKGLYRTANIDITINEYGLPISGLGDVNLAIPVAFELQLLITIGRTARVARFIQASTVMKSKVNWYWVFQRINPHRYWTNYRRRISLQSSNSLEIEDTSKSEVGNKGRDSKSGIRSSWGGVHLGVLATLKAIQMEEERTRYAEAQKLHDKGIIGFVKKVMRYLGILRGDDEEIRRHIAATKIQRAWRANVGQHLEDAAERSSDKEDVAWDSRRDLHTRNTVENVTPKNSILRHYSVTAKSFTRSGAKNGISRRSILSMSSKNSSQARTAVSRRKKESQVGSAMRELTGQRVAIGIIVALILTVLFTYTENDATWPSTMIVLHNQTGNALFADVAIQAARASSVPKLYQYNFSNGQSRSYNDVEDTTILRDFEIVKISITDAFNLTTIGLFDNRAGRKNEAWVELCSTIFILLVWFFGVAAFAGPVMTLVVIPIERMVRLLGMLMIDPLGYQSTPRYKKFVAEEDELTKNTRWTKEVLKGMETSFLMSTILRIGSLMKVGFGSAGVEIIRNNLERGHTKNMLILNSQGSTVSCIFLFCDIRQFTDATECLQEEVFVFTNRIAAVVHSICHAYGGSANKNIGDAFLLSWLLEDDGTKTGRPATGRGRVMRSETRNTSSNSAETFTAKSNQADKALLSVVKICMALHHDKFYIETMSETARENLLTKLSKRKGPVVQMGFGLHAGKAVQGAIGSQRKIDATYVSESVERAEFLESSTKKYGLNMLMSDNFHRLLHPSNRRRCRKVDQIMLQNDDDDEEDVYEGDVMELFTFDMDIDALWRVSAKKTSVADGDGGSDTESVNENTKGSKREALEKKPLTRNAGPGLLKGPRRRSVNRLKSGVAEMISEEFKISANSEAAALDVATNAAGSTEFGHEADPSIRHVPPELVLPTGPTLYNANVWLSDDLRKIRELFSDGLFFQKFNSGLQSYYARDWEHAKQCFQTILERFDDGPSRYFLECIDENNGIPPRNFMGYGTA